MSESRLMILFEKPSEHTLLRIFLILLGFSLGWLGTHYIVALFYPTTGPICIAGLHFHHLYIGLIILGIGLPFFFITKNRLQLLFLFIWVFGAGMVFDDIMDHFILQIDPFEFWCS